MEFDKYQYIGKLNIEFLEAEFGKLATDELILTDERDAHIKQRHGQDYILFHQCLYDVVEMPDMILKDSKNHNTVFYIKYIEETHLNIVVRLSLAVGKTQTDAQNTLANQNLKYNVTTDYSDSVAEGQIISQSIDAGKTVAPGTTVTIVVSLGKK